MAVHNRHWVCVVADESQCGCASAGVPGFKSGSVRWIHAVNRGQYAGRLNRIDRREFHRAFANRQTKTSLFLTSTSSQCIHWAKGHAFIIKNERKDPLP